MKGIFAYVCAADQQAVQAACRKLYELGYTPISPSIMFAFLNENDPAQREDKRKMALSLLRRCRVLVVCSAYVTEEMQQEIMLARRLSIVATTLTGIKTIEKHIEAPTS